MEGPTLESVKRNPLRLTCNAINPMLTPAKKFDLPTEVISNELIAENHYLLRCFVSRDRRERTPWTVHPRSYPTGQWIAPASPVYDLHR